MKRATRKDKCIFWAEAPEVGESIDVWKLALLRLVLVLSGVYLLLIAVCQGFDLTLKPSIYPALAVTAVYGLFAAYRRKWAALILVPGVLYSGWQCYRNIKLLENGLYYFENIFIDNYNRHYGTDITPYYTQYSESRALTMFFTVVFVLLTIVLVAVVMNRYLRYCWAVCVTVVFAAMLFVNVFPKIIIFLGVIVHCLTVVWSGTIENCGNAEKGKITGSIVCFLTGCMILTALFCGKNTYTDLIENNSWRMEMQDRILNTDPEKLLGKLGDRFEKFWDKGTGSVKKNSNAGMAGGRLDRGGHGLEVTGETHLLVTIPDNINTMYLRGYIGAIYNGAAWKTAPVTAEWYDVNRSVFDSTTYTGKLIQSFFTYGKNSYRPLWEDGYRMSEFMADMKVQIVGADKRYFYAPYDTCDHYGYAEWEMEKPLQNTERKDRYELQFCYNEYNLPFFFAFSDGEFDINKLSKSDFATSAAVRAALLGYQGDTMANLTNYQKSYRKYVDSVYLDIPKCCASVKGLLNSTGSLAGDVELVVSYLQNNYAYTRELTMLEPGEDYIENFLFDSHAGYCMHFASAAVMLYRSLGIPARYVEGYYVDTDLLTCEKTVYPVENQKLETDGRWSVIRQNYIEVEVPDASAHAWVEIYLDYYGWCPIEVTAGYGGVDFSALPTLAPTIPVEKPTPKPTSVPTNKPTQAPDMTVSPKLTPEATKPISATLTPTVTEPVKRPTSGANENPSGSGEGQEGSPNNEPGNKPETSRKETNGSTFGRKAAEVLPWIMSMLLLAMIVALAAKGAKSAKQRRRRALGTGEKNRRVFRCYAEIVKLLRLAGIRQKLTESESEFFARAEAAMKDNGAEVSVAEACRIAEKTRFSENGATESEAQRMFTICENVTAFAGKNLKGCAKWRFSVSALLK